MDFLPVKGRHCGYIVAVLLSAVLYLRFFLFVGNKYCGKWSAG